MKNFKIIIAAIVLLSLIGFSVFVIFAYTLLAVKITLVILLIYGLYLVGGNIIKQADKINKEEQSKNKARFEDLIDELNDKK